MKTFRLGRSPGMAVTDDDAMVRRLCGWRPSEPWAFGQTSPVRAKVSSTSMATAFCSGPRQTPIGGDFCLAQIEVRGHGNVGENGTQQGQENTRGDQRHSMIET